LEALVLLALSGMLRAFASRLIALIAAIVVSAYFLYDEAGISIEIRALLSVPLMVAGAWTAYRSSTSANVVAVTK
jgi:hypothetical protein